MCTGSTGAFADTSERKLAQAPDLAHCRTILRRIEQENLLAVLRPAEAFAAAQRAADRGGRFRMRDR